MIFFSYMFFSDRVFDLNVLEFNFLFNDNWPNSIDEAIKRLDALIEHGRAPYKFVPSKNSWSYNLEK